MTDDTTVVRWRREGGTGYSLYHLPIQTNNDTEGRTQCGLEYKRRRSEQGTRGDGVLCRNCERTERGTVPGVMP